MMTILDRLSRLPVNSIIAFTYENYKGKTSQRAVSNHYVWQGKSVFHEDKQWFLTAYDLEKRQDRDFAIDKMTQIKINDDIYKKDKEIARLRLWLQYIYDNPNAATTAYKALNAADSIPTNYEDSERFKREYKI